MIKLILFLSSFTIMMATQNFAQDFDFSKVKSCSPKKKIPHSKKLLKDLTWLNFEPTQITSADIFTIQNINEKHKTTDITFIGHNTYLANCAGYNREAISKKLSLSLRQGLSCLSHLNRHRRKDAAILLSFLDSRYSSPLVIRCELNGANEYMGRDTYPGWDNEKTINGIASAFVCTNNLYPSAIFSKWKLNKIISAENTDEASTFFHELLHLLGYLHMDKDFDSWGYDFVYQVIGCCFPNSINRELNPVMDLEHSCNRLKKMRRRI